MTLPLIFLRSAGPPSPPQLLSTRSLLPVFFDVLLSPASRLRTLPLLLLPVKSSHSKLEYYLDVACAHVLVGTYLHIQNSERVKIEESIGKV